MSALEFTALQRKIGDIDSRYLDCSGAPGAGKTFFLYRLPIYKKWVENPRFLGLYVNFSFAYWTVERCAHHYYPQAAHDRNYRTHTWHSGARMIATIGERNLHSFTKSWGSFSFDYVALDNIPNDKVADFLISYFESVPAATRYLRYTVNNREGIFTIPVKNNNLTPDEWDTVLKNYEDARATASI